jgi:hypothetical protein
MPLTRFIGAPLMAAAFPRIIRIVIGNIGNNNLNGNIAINLNNNINNNNNNNNNEDPNDMSLLRMRARLFRVLFMKIAVIYAIAIPITIRKAIEWSILLIAFLSLFVLCHLHVTFIRTPINCLDHVQNDWPRDGILRVQILNDPHDNNHQIINNNNNQINSNQKQDNSSVDFGLNDSNEDIVVVERNGVEEVLYDVNNNNKFKSNDFVNNDENKDKELSDYYYSNLSSFDVKDLIDYSNQINNNNENNGYPQPLKEKVSHLQMIARAGNLLFNINYNLVIDYSFETKTLHLISILNIFQSF